MPRSSAPLVIDDDPVDTASTMSTTPDEFNIPGPDEETSFEPDFDPEAMGFDEARDEAERRKLRNPQGDWVKEDVWDFDKDKNISFFVDDKKEGDISKKGRVLYTLWGYPSERHDKEGNTFMPFLRVRMSPDIRPHREKEGKNDMAYRLWLSAWDLFVNMYDRKPQNHMELLRALANDTYLINTMTADDGAVIVLQLKKPRVQR